MSMEGQVSHLPFSLGGRTIEVRPFLLQSQLLWLRRSGV